MSEPCSDKHHGGITVRETSDDPCPATDLLHDPFQSVIRPQTGPVFIREIPHALHTEDRLRREERTVQGTGYLRQALQFCSLILRWSDSMMLAEESAEISLIRKSHFQSGFSRRNAGFQQLDRFPDAKRR